MLLFQGAQAQIHSKSISLDDIFKKGTFNMARVKTMKSMNDGETFCLLNGDSLNLYAYKTGKYISTIVEAQQLIPEEDSLPISMSNYSFSSDEKRILFATNTEMIYRRSSKSKYYIFNIETNKLVPLSENGKQQLADFSPDGYQIAFVRGNNIFIKDLNANTETQITFNGELNKIINGAPDWVYEEEFGFSKGFYWSPDSKKIAFYRFDESYVKEFNMMIWGKLYPELSSFKYPKAGEDNSLVSIHVYNLEDGKTIKMDIGDEPDIYIPRIKWTKDPDILSIQWMNRLQNELKILLTNFLSGESQTIYHEKNKYYIDISDNLTFLSDKEHFIFSNEENGFHHLYLYDMLGNLENQITSGNFDVQEFIGIDEEKNLVYYTSSESSPLNRELYTTNTDGSGKKLLSEKLGNNSVQFSKNYKYYLNSFSNSNTPPHTALYSQKGKQLRVIENNDKLKQITVDYNFQKREFFTFTTNENIELNAWMIKPPGFDPTKKYPVLMYVYGGPGSQTVRNSWGRNDAWYQMLAQKGLIIVSVDNRGTGARGEEFKKMTYMQLGKYETIDQIEAAKYLGSLDYVDKDRIGIWGWSYGGYMSASCLFKGAEFFSMAIAVAPVTNWRYYDNIYTERFMRKPIENPEGYDENSPINHVDKLAGKLLLIHGTADDNVHYQNSIDLISALVGANKQFDMQFYPNSNHGIYTGKNTRYHLYSKMTDFIEENLLK
ncbi:MAG: S9 family peptidase [Bacteroidales bacterium]|nr:S9 family peptidase [Bacteroidales bacterium]MCF8404983.1 S9 family peptidase [Bacteroidales bacterium]